MYDRICNIFIKLADWSSQPIIIILFPIICALYLYMGGQEGRLTLILSVLAISMTQMVLRAQTLETEVNKLQIAEIVKAMPKARNEVLKPDLTHEDRVRMKKEIEDEVSDRV